MTRTALKEWTDILTPWIQVLALLAAGVFALTEYLGNKQQMRVQRAADYLSRFNSEDVVSARIRLSQREQAKVGRFREVLLNKTMPRDQKNVAYYTFVIQELVAPDSAESLDASFRRVLGYLEEGVICAKQGLCDEATVRAGHSDYSQFFSHTYAPYLCYLRDAWHDPTIGERVDSFYNQPAAGKACKGYYDSIQRVLSNQKLTAATPPNPSL